MQLLWIIFIGLIFALITQSLAANLGVTTGKTKYIFIPVYLEILFFNQKKKLRIFFLGCAGKHLSELCKAEYPKYVTYSLWLLAEVAVIAADIPEGS